MAEKFPPNPRQKEAIEYLEGPLLVLAGPGTGKTQIISGKVKYILENTDADPSNILCVTFSDAASENMRERMRDPAVIGNAADKVNIFTYHSFGVNILSEYSHYATEPVRVLSDAIDEISQYKIIFNIIKNLDVKDILRSADPRDIIQTIGEAKQAGLSANDLRIISDKNISDYEQISSMANEILQNLVPRMKINLALEQVYIPLANLLKDFSNNQQPILKNIPSEGETYLHTLANTIEEATTVNKLTPLTNWVRSNFEKDELGNYRLSSKVKNLKLKSLANIYAQYEDYLHTNDVFDFDDMIIEAIKVLKNDEGFRLTLSERYQYILLDEYQDTNDSQAEIIHLLTDYEKPMIMAVGDDDQAIYAFQGARSSNMKEFGDHYHAHTVALTENYRSTGDILQLSRVVAEQISDSYSKASGIPKILEAKRAFSNCAIDRHVFVDPTAEYHFIADEIKRLIDNGVKQSEIAILAPKHSAIAPILPHLRIHPEIKIAYEKRDNVFADPRIEVLYKFATLIYELSQNWRTSVSFLELLSLPFLEFSPETAIRTNIEFRNSKKSMVEFLIDQEDTKLHNLGLFLTSAITKAKDTTLELFIDYLTGATQLDGIYSNFFNYYSNHGTEFNKFEFYELLHTLRSTIIKHFKTQEPRLADFINLRAEYEACNHLLLNTSPYQDANDAVQIMSVHKSKGLEFEYVFLISADNQRWGVSNGNNNRLSLPPNMVSIRHTGTTNDECLRLLFVAITRAKHHLVLTSSTGSFDDKKHSPINYISEECLELKNHDVDSYNLADLSTSWEAAYLEPDANLRTILKKKMENYKLSASDLVSFIDIAYGGPQEFYKSKILGANNDGYARQLVFGSLIHSTFEAVTNKKLDTEAAIKFFEDTVKSDHSIPAEDIEGILDEGRYTITKSLEKFGNIIAAEDSHAELGFYGSSLIYAGVPLVGFIDHINIHDKEIDVYDYKTSKYKEDYDKGWDRNASTLKYELQLEFYRLLLTLSPDYRNHTVKSGHILFVTPNPELIERGRDCVVDKPLYFDGNILDENSDFIRLVKSVYKHITTLDFLDNPKIFIPADQSNGVKKMREFIQMLINES